MTQVHHLLQFLQVQEILRLRSSLVSRGGINGQVWVI